MISIFQEFPLQILTYFILVLTFASFWISTDKRVPVVFFSISILLGLSAGSIDYIALLSIAIIGGLTYFFYQKKLSPIARVFLFISIFAVTILIFLHKMPGFSNWQVYPEIKLSEKSASFPFWLNFDKPLIAFFLLLFAYSPLTKLAEYKDIIKKSFPFLLGLIVVLFVFGTALQYVVFDPKLPSFDVTFLWAIKMLFFTALVEEFFFRFFIQNNVILVFKKFKHGQLIGLLLSSLLFGLFHFSGGISFVFLAFISGLIYGGVYLKTKRLESAILVHFVVNFMHFIFFSYPYFVGASS